MQAIIYSHGRKTVKMEQLTVYKWQVCKVLKSTDNTNIEPVPAGQTFLYTNDPRWNSEAVRHERDISNAGR
jgi:hypothetical protein